MKSLLKTDNLTPSEICMHDRHGKKDDYPPLSSTFIINQNECAYKITWNQMK